MDPLLIGEVNVNPGFELKNSNMTAFGISDFKVEKMRVNVEQKIKVGRYSGILLVHNWNLNKYDLSFASSIWC